MDIAQRLRKQNISEYILYLWQIEDLLRAMQMSPEAVFSQLVAPRQVPEADKQLILAWYMDMAEVLRSEGKEQSGHLQHTLHLIAGLQELHRQLLELPAGEEYRKLYAMTAPFLPELREKLGRQQVGDIELCFRALYAAMLYKIKGERQQLAEQVVQTVSPLVAELSRIFHEVERGETDLYKQ